MVAAHRGPVTCVSFCPASPHTIAVTAGTKVSLYDPRTRTLTRQHSRFQDVAYSGELRRDGKLLAAGGEQGLIQVFDAASRTLLRQFKGHQKPVRLTRWSADKVHLLSGSDDVTVRLWDITAGRMVHRFDGHGDYVRAGAACPSSADLFATGGYDHVIKLWDTRARDCVMTLDHGAPVEACVFLPGRSTVLVTGGGTEVRVWDVLGGGKPVTCMGNHQKTVTSLAVVGSSGGGEDDAEGEGEAGAGAGESGPYASRRRRRPTVASRLGGGAHGPRLLTGSLDGHVKVYELDTFQVTHAIRHEGPVTAVGISPDLGTLAVGLGDGTLILKRQQRADVNDDHHDTRINRSTARGGPGGLGHGLGHGQDDGDDHDHDGVVGDRTATTTMSPVDDDPFSAAVRDARPRRRWLTAHNYQYYIRGQSSKPTADDIIIHPDQDQDQDQDHIDTMNACDKKHRFDKSCWFS